MNLNSLIDIALSNYIGYKCQICGRNYLNLELVKESHLICMDNKGENMNVACKICYDSQEDPSLVEKIEDVFSEDKK